MDYRGVKVITHASTFFAPILVPILVWLLVQNRDAKNMALQALVFHIIMTVLIAISWFFAFLLIGIPFLIVFGLMAIYYPVKGIIYSLNGRPFSYPFVGGIGR